MGRGDGGFINFLWKILHDPPLPIFSWVPPQTSTYTCVTPLPPSIFGMPPLLARKFSDAPLPEKKPALPPTHKKWVVPNDWPSRTEEVVVTAGGLAQW